jgi:Tol biopolymer transport system component
LAAPGIRNGPATEPHGHGEAIMPQRITRAFVYGLAIAALGTSVPAWGQGATERVSLGPNGVQGDGPSEDTALSADGRFVAFGSEASTLVPDDTNGGSDVFVHDRQTGRTTRVSVGPNGRQSNNGSYQPALSAGGRVVAFTSLASNLVPGDTNDAPDVFVRDRQTGTTRRVSVSSGGAQGNAYSYTPSISADGRFVAFASDATK